jgi:poly-gamma-glutamate capsule biosynthesis protein CapA/YwtB (metallophosphatase superfamily)
MGSVYSFRMKPSAAAALRRAGFDVLSVANNHAGDWGPTALGDTMALLEQQGISVVGAGDSGAEADKAIVVEAKGLGVAFMSFSDVGPNWLNASTTKPGIAIAQSAERVSEAVRRSASTTNADLLIVSFHFGEEYSSEPTVRQIELARAAITAGADIVVGHHPHVVQKTESYNGGVIVYSLGNFIFDQNFSKETMTGGALEVYIINGKIAWYKLREVQINSRFQAIIE